MNPRGRLHEVYRPTSESFTVWYRRHSLTIYSENSFDKYNHELTLTSTQKANQEHASTVVLGPSDMNFHHPPIVALGTPQPETIPETLKDYALGVESRTESGYLPPRAATMAMAVPHSDPIGRRSEGDRPLADSMVRIAFGSSDVRDERGKRERYAKASRIKARTDQFPPEMLPRDDWRRLPGTSGPGDPGKRLAKSVPVGNCGEYEALAQLWNKLEQTEFIGLYTVSLPQC